MKRSAPLKRTGFKPARPARPVKTIDYTPRPRATAVPMHDGKARLVVSVPKQQPIQHEAYMAAVRTLPCYRCGIVGFTQFCHADQGKGAGLKTDCRLGWPGCGPHPDAAGRLLPGCHYDVGTAGLMTKAARRAFEDEAGQATRAVVRARGHWPASLPNWPADSLVEVD